MCRYGLRLATITVQQPNVTISTIQGYNGIANTIRVAVRKKHSAHQADWTRIQSAGFEIKLNPRDQSSSAFIDVLGCWEPLITGLFMKVLSKGQVIVDVGANIGWYTLLSAALVGPRGLVISFEPEPSNFALLAQSIARNAFSNVRLLRAAVGDREGQTTLNLSSMSVGHTLRNSLSAAEFIGNLPVKIETLDSALSDLRTDIHLLKVDVEGAEPEVINGSMKLISSGRIKRIVMEWNPGSWVGLGENIRLLFHAYRVYWLQSSRTLVPAPPILMLKSLSLDELPTTPGYLYCIKK